MTQTRVYIEQDSMLVLCSKIGFTLNKLFY